jgi:hypothetical protein
MLCPLELQARTHIVFSWRCHVNEIAACSSADALSGRCCVIIRTVKSEKKQDVQSPVHPGLIPARLKVGWTVLLAEPVFLFAVAYVIRASGLVPLVKDFEHGVPAIIEYVVFFAGLAVFFFSDGFAHFLARKIFIRKDKTRAEASPARYMLLLGGAMSVVNLIGFCGFVGFLICGNIVWLGLFVLLNLSLQFKYFPSSRRLELLISHE